MSNGVNGGKEKVCEKGMGRESKGENMEGMQGGESGGDKGERIIA